MSVLTVAVPQAFAGTETLLAWGTSPGDAQPTAVNGTSPVLNITHTATTNEAIAVTVTLRRADTTGATPVAVPAGVTYVTTVATANVTGSGTGGSLSALSCAGATCTFTITTAGGDSGAVIGVTLVGSVVNQPGGYKLAAKTATLTTEVPSAGFAIYGNSWVTSTTKAGVVLTPIQPVAAAPNQAQSPAYVFVPSAVSTNVTVTLNTGGGAAVGSGVSMTMGTPTATAGTSTVPVCTASTATPASTNCTFTLSGEVAGAAVLVTLNNLKVNTSGSYQLVVTDNLDTPTSFDISSTATPTGAAGSPFTISATSGTGCTTPGGQAVACSGTFKLIFTTEPGNDIDGQPFQTAPVITLQDANGNTATTISGNILIQLQDQFGTSLPSTNGGPQLYTSTNIATCNVAPTSQSTQPGTCPQNTTGATVSTNLPAMVGCANNQCVVPLTNGVASPVLSIDTILDPDNARGYSIFQLAATADTTLTNNAGGGVTGATSTQFQQMVGTPNQEVKKGTPAGAAKTQLLHTQPSIEIDDAGTNEVDSDKTDTVTVQLLDAASQNPPTNGAVLLGTLTQTVGKTTPARAIWTDLSITQNGDYDLRFTSSAPIGTCDLGPIYPTATNGCAGGLGQSTTAPTAGSEVTAPAGNWAGTTVIIRDNQLVVVSSPTRSGPPVMAGGPPLSPVVVELTDSSGTVQNSNQWVAIKSSSNQNFNYNGGTGTVAYAQMIAGIATFAGISIPLQGTCVGATGPTLPSGAAGAACVTTNSKGSKSSFGWTAYIYNDPAPATINGVTGTATVDPAGGAYTRGTYGGTANIAGPGNTAPAGVPSFAIHDKQLLFTSQPGTANAGAALSTNPVIELANGQGTVVSDNTHTATIALGDQNGKALAAGTAKLTGSGCTADGTSCTVTFVGGAAVFNGISIDQPGTYTLIATTNAVDSDGKAAAGATSLPFTVGGTAVVSAGGGAASTVPSLPASSTAPPNTDLTAIYASIPALKDIKTANVTWSYLGPSAVVVELLTPPLWTSTFPVGCYSGPNATSSEASASVLFGIKPAGSDFILFFIRGTRAYSFDVAFGNYCWIDLIAQ